MTGSLQRQTLQTNDADRARLWAGGLLAAGLHALIAFGLPKAIVTQAEFSMQAPAENIEVELIEAQQAESTPPELPAPPPPITVPETPPPVPMPAPVVKEIIPDPPLPPPPLPKEETLAKVEEQPAPPPEPKPAPPPQTTPKPAPPKPVKAPSATESNAASNKSPGPATQTGASGTTSKPSALYNPPPSYRSESKRAKEEGSLLLSVQVNASGRADTVTISKSSGYQSLDRAASEAVRRWKFKPATRNGEPIATIVDVPIVFRLKQ
jgi:protein TonB